MTRYYTEAELAEAVRRQAAIDRMYYSNYQSAVQTQNRSWLYELVRGAVRFVFGTGVADFLTFGIDVVWDYFADLFS